VLGTRNENNQLVAVQLTVDLKPNIPSKFCIFFFSNFLIYLDAVLQIYGLCQSCFVQYNCAVLGFNVVYSIIFGYTPIFSPVL
jgi:hypothetical protein